MLAPSPFGWLLLLLLGLPFASAGVIARVGPLQRLSVRHHRVIWTTGAVGMCAFIAGFAGLLPSAWGLPAVIIGGAVAGFACFWPGKPDDGGEDWRRWSLTPDDWSPPPGLPDTPTDWREFDRLRAGWERRPRVGR